MAWHGCPGDSKDNDLHVDKFDCNDLHVDKFDCNDLHVDTFDCNDLHVDTFQYIILLKLFTNHHTPSDLCSKHQFNQIPAIIYAILELFSMGGFMLNETPCLNKEFHFTCAMTHIFAKHYISLFFIIVGTF
ncbi:hypothetical protein ACJX0J_022060 [Zea mays]